MSHLSSKKGQGGRSRDLQTSKPHLSLWGHYGKNPPGSHYQIKKDKVFQNSQRRFIKDKSYLTILTTFSDKKTSSVDERRAADVILILVTVYQCPIAPVLPNWEGNACMSVVCKGEKKLVGLPGLKKSGNNSKFS